MLRVLCLRRDKGSVELALPPKLELQVSCPLSAQQTALYRALLLRHAAVIDAHTQAGLAAAGRSIGDIKILKMLCMQLRHVCGHPSLLWRTEDADAPEASADMEQHVAASGKLAVLDRLLARLRAGGHRVVLFTQFTRVLDLLAEYADARGYAFARLDGAQGRARRTIDMMTVRGGCPCVRCARAAATSALR